MNIPSSIILRVMLVAGLMDVAASATADWWQDCAAEREQFCKGIPVGGGRIAACVDEHSAELSARCRASRPSQASQRQQAPGAASVASSPAAAGNYSSSDYRPIYQADFQGSIDGGLMLQQPRGDSIQISPSPCSPSRNALRVSIRRQDDFSRVANGAPRAEVNFLSRFAFQQGREYRISWSTCLPTDFQFDSKQPEGITQIHSSQPKGSPPFGLSLNGGRYEVQLRDGERTATYDLGNASGDRGRWVRWTFHYRPDATGAKAIAELEKDGTVVVNGNGQPNAYPGDDRGYLKMGIYKWWWKDRPTDVDQRTVYFSNLVVEGR